MKVNDWLNTATGQLGQADIDSARLDCLILLEDILKKDRAWILAHPNYFILEPSLEKLSALLKRREKHEPLAYIRGKAEFYGREFLVNKNVLVPRPETEDMITLLLSLTDSEQLISDSKIADVGTGSGALGITAALELPKMDVTLTDIDEEALALVRKNAKLHGVNLKILQGDLFEPLSANGYRLTAILANLPYVPDDYKINKAAQSEPRLAIFGGKDGLDLYRKLFSQLASLKSNAQRPRFVLAESLPAQHSELAKIAKNTGYKPQDTEGLIQLFSLLA